MTRFPLYVFQKFFKVLFSVASFYFSIFDISLAKKVFLSNFRGDSLWDIFFEVETFSENEKISGRDVGGEKIKMREGDLERPSTFFKN